MCWSGVHKVDQVQQLVLWTTSPSSKVTEKLLWRRLAISMATPYISKETYHRSSRMLPPLRYSVSAHSQDLLPAVVETELHHPQIYQD